MTTQSGGLASITTQSGKSLSLTGQKNGKSLANLKNGRSDGPFRLSSGVLSGGSVERSSCVGCGDPLSATVNVVRSAV